jgi:hypothetical protein
VVLGSLPSWTSLCMITVPEDPLNSMGGRRAGWEGMSMSDTQCGVPKKENSMGVWEDKLGR